MEKKITVKEFIEKYNSINDDDKRIEFIKNHIVDRYVPYEEKATVCKRIIKASSKSEIDGKSVYHQNSIARYMLFGLNMIDLYTDIVIDFGESLKQFNLFDKYNLIEEIMDNILYTEKRKMETILQMVSVDYYENERSIQSNICKINEIILSVANEFTKCLRDSIDDETIKKIKDLVVK